MKQHSRHDQAVQDSGARFGLPSVDGTRSLVVAVFSGMEGLIAGWVWLLDSAPSCFNELGVVTDSSILRALACAARLGLLRCSATWVRGEQHLTPGQ